MHVVAFLRRFSVGKRIAAIVLLMLLPLAGLSVFSAVVLSRQEVSFGESVEESIHTLLPITSLEQYLQRALVDELEAASGERVANFGALTTNIDDTFSRLQDETSATDLLWQELGSARSAWRDARPSIQQLVEQARRLHAGTDTAAEARAQGDLEQSIRDIADVRAHLTRALQARYERAARARRTALYWLIAAWVGTLSFAALMIGVFLFSLLQPIRGLGRTAHRLGAGEHAARAAVVGNDELTDLARCFNEMATYWQASSESLHATAAQDTLTGVLNRRGITQVLDDELARHRAQNQTLSVFLMDLDRFKQINDAFGHDVGDRALVWVAGQLSESLRNGDHLGRYGGDEFVVILPRTPLVPARDIADRLSDRVRELAEADPRYPQISVGVASTAESGFDRAVLLKKADAGLYERKRWRRAHDTVSASGQKPFT